MGRSLRTLEELLPGYLRHMLSWDFLPWDHVGDHHSDLSDPSLTALFDAYLNLDSYLDLESIASQDIPEGSWGCSRCGFCCTSRRPGPVTADTIWNWEKAQAPIALFYSARGQNKRNPAYRCWYHNGIRLRICPFMFVNRNDSRPFCSIYHMGDDFRPPACSGYLPRHKTCNASSLEIEPWESS